MCVELLASGVILGNALDLRNSSVKGNIIKTETETSLLRGWVPSIRSFIIIDSHNARAPTYVICKN